MTKVLPERHWVERCVDAGRKPKAAHSRQAPHCRRQAARINRERDQQRRRGALQPALPPDQEEHAHLQQRQGLLVL